VILAVPLAIEVTRPVDDTVATVVSDVVHVTVALSIAWPFASVTVAVSWVVSASEPNVSVESDKDTAAITWPTLTVAVALAGPDVAVIVAEPSATEVTRPVDDTVATEAADVVHVTVALAIVAPFWSLTVAEIWDVTPREARLRLVTERVIDVATGVGVGVGAVGVLSPPQLHNNSENTTAPNATVGVGPVRWTVLD
jgi:hypothetical protein